METVKKVAEEWNVVKKHEAHHHLGEGINHSDEDYSTKEEKAAHADQSDSSAETQLQQSNVKKSEDLTKTTSSEDSVVITTEEKQESDSNPMAAGLVIVERSFNITARGSKSPTVRTGSPGQFH
eukprot:Gb_18761 [translate_table: standard]